MMLALTCTGVPVSSTRRFVGKLSSAAIVLFPPLDLSLCPSSHISKPILPAPGRGSWHNRWACLRTCIG